MRLFWAIHNNIKHTENFLNSVGVFAVVGMMFLTVADIVGRNLFNNPIPGTYQISELLMIPEVYLALSYTQRIGGHVEVDMLYVRLPARAKLALDLFGNLLTLAAMIMITWQGSLAALDSYQVGERAWGLIRVPLLPFRVIIVIGCFLYCIRCIISLWNTILKFAGVKVKYD